MIKETPDGLILPIKLIPKADRNEIKEWENDELKIRIYAIPEKGEANRELIRFLSKAFKIPQSQMQLISGETNRHKRVSIKGINETDLSEKIKALQKK